MAGFCRNFVKMLRRAAIRLQDDGQGCLFYHGPDGCLRLGWSRLRTNRCAASSEGLAPGAAPCRHTTSFPRSMLSPSTRTSLDVLTLRILACWRGDVFVLGLLFNVTAGRSHGCAALHSDSDIPFFTAAGSTSQLPSTACLRGAFVVCSNDPGFVKAGPRV